MKKASKLSALLLTILLVSYTPKPEEGMYPISFLGNMNLKEMGLNLEANDIFNLNGNGLINAIVNINGCTGSFVSNEGLILTNHHCIFSSLRPHTTEKNNYMRDGFLAQNGEQELPMEGYKVKIMKSYEDISQHVLAGVDKAKDALERQKLIDKNIKSLRDKEEKEYPEMEINISEMLVGASYFLFRYEFLTDVRLVYVPARYIGEFGGETDNWMWPRHSGDFSFVRAYIGKDGKPAAYDKSNVPYKPQRFLQVNPQGVDDEDLVFILGYPGRTYRHYPAEFINYMQTVQMPYISETWDWQIDQMEGFAKESDRNMIKYSNRIKRLANTMKNYKGKIQSLRRIGLYEKKKEEEGFVYDKLRETNPELADEFQATLDEMNRIYGDMMKLGEKRFWFWQLRSGSNYNAIAQTLASLNAQLPAKGDKSLSEEDLNKAIERVIKGLRPLYKTYDVRTDALFCQQILNQGIHMDIQGLSEHVGNSEQSVDAFVQASYAKNKISDSAYVFKMLRKSPSKIAKLKDPFVQLHISLLPDEGKTQNALRSWNAQLDQLRPKYVDAKMEAKGDLFIPDANGTLRFTYGFIKGYNPADGVYSSPVSTVQGILEKAANPGDYDLGDDLKQAIKTKNSGDYFKKALGSVPVNILYNTDTSGGNSGSPILDKDGNLIGLNFDRAFESCVNDFAWNDAYSRSIGVDIRYILWVAQNVDNANSLVSEMTN